MRTLILQTCRGNRRSSDRFDKSSSRQSQGGVVPVCRVRGGLRSWTRTRVVVPDLEGGMLVTETQGNIFKEMFFYNLKGRSAAEFQHRNQSTESNIRYWEHQKNQSAPNSLPPP